MTGGRLELIVSELSKSHAGRPVLNRCSHSFATGGISVLMGPNGSGKSTLLRICALLERPDDGRVIYLSGGRHLPEDMGLRRRITLVLPKAGLFNGTVFSNLAYGLIVRGLKRSEIRERVENYLGVFGLGEKGRQKALTLSSGEAQRLSIARAVVIEPEILFLDEPTASVDEKNREIIENIILGMKDMGRPTVIMTTHDPVQAKRLGDRLLILREGKIERM